MSKLKIVHAWNFIYLDVLSKTTSYSWFCLFPNNYFIVKNTYQPAFAPPGRISLLPPQRVSKRPGAGRALASAQELPRQRRPSPIRLPGSNGEWGLAAAEGRAWRCVGRLLHSLPLTPTVTTSCAAVARPRPRRPTTMTLPSSRARILIPFAHHHRRPRRSLPLTASSSFIFSLASLVRALCVLKTLSLLSVTHFCLRTPI